MNTPVQPTNIFAMFQRNNNCHYPCVRIDFTEIKDPSQSSAKGGNVFKKIIPSYNNDGLYFTDAFVLQAQNSKKSNDYINSSEAFSLIESREKFDNKIQKVTENMDIEEIFKAEPQSFFCQICRSSFENYHEHIQAKDHIRNLQFSKGYKFIKQICKQAKKHLQTDQKNERDSSVEKIKKSKSMIQKKVVSGKNKKPKKGNDKKVKSEHSGMNIQTKSSEENLNLNCMRAKKEKFVSIINDQMKQGSVEKLSIQNIK